jgi:cytochrome c oxidase cbb3-type subunit III
MSSRCREHVVIGALAALVLAMAGCESEQREFRAQTWVPPTAPQVSVLRAGPGGWPAGAPTERVASPPAHSTDQPFQDNRWAVGEGQRLYSWFNCAGCHSPGGGGGMGPPFIDADWRYGNAPHEVFASIVEGRPNGMPSFRDRMPAADTWKLVAYVRTLGALTPKDVWPARADSMAETQRESPRSGSAEAENLRDIDR